MNLSNKLFLSVLALISINASAMQVIRDRTAFRVVDGDVEHGVKNYDVCKPLRGLSEENLQRFEKLGGRYKAIKLSNGDYIVREQGELKGGGPGLSALIAIVGYPVVGVAALGTLVGVAATGDFGGALTAAGAVATGGCIAVTYAVVAAAGAPTP